MRPLVLKTSHFLNAFFGNVYNEVSGSKLKNTKYRGRAVSSYELAGSLKVKEC